MWNEIKKIVNETYILYIYITVRSRESEPVHRLIEKWKRLGANLSGRRRMKEESTLWKRLRKRKRLQHGSPLHDHCELKGNTEDFRKSKICVVVVKSVWELHVLAKFHISVVFAWLKTFFFSKWHQDLRSNYSLYEQMWPGKPSLLLKICKFMSQNQMCTDLLKPHCKIFHPMDKN